MTQTEGATGKAPVWLKLAHGSGAAAFGIKNGGFDYFLLLFYGTVIGLEPGLVGLAILIALVVDAISDPLVGYWSDNFRSRWGRRHPFMYAAALPVALSYFLLWNPPDWGQTGLFVYLTVLAVLIRTFITFYETPSSALIPELTTDYADRTSLQAYRLLFGWSAGTGMSVVMFGVLLTGPLGMRDPDAYATYGIIASVLIFATIMMSALGTHSRIPYLHQPVGTGERYNVGRIFREMLQTLSEKSFIALFLATMLFAIASGLSAALAFLAALPAAGAVQCKNLWWVHTPKTGSTFALTLASACCPERFRAAFAEDVAHFARACRGGAAPKVRRGDAVLATLVAEAARRSAACGRPVALKNPAGSADPADLVLVEG